MKLVSCYIDHFGKISDFTHDFSDGFNGILQDNGWGKTTFSVFLKAMFYGMKYSPKTKKELLERNHYMPWDGGTFGGNLVFEIDGKKYRVERTFGKTDKDDTFGLFDVATGAASSDFSENLGEELFQVDCESFTKSVYVPQQLLATTMTDSLNAKMGNLASAKDDISNFDKALKAVNDAKTEYTRNSKINPGKLVWVKNELKKNKTELEVLPALQESYDARQLLLDKKVERLEELTAQKASILEKIQVQSKREQELGAYRSKKEDLERETKRLAQLDEFFVNGVPTSEDLERLSKLDRELAVHESTLGEKKQELLKASVVYQEPFENGVPSDKEFEEWNQLATRLSELRAKGEQAKLSDESEAKIGELKYFFSKHLPTMEELAAIEKQAATLNLLDGRILGERERVLTLKAQNSAKEKIKEAKSSPVPVIIFVLFAAGLAALGFLFTYYQTGVLSIIMQILGFGGAVAVLIGAVTYLKKRSTNLRAQVEETEEELRGAENQLEMSEAQRKELADTIDAFLSNFLLTRADTMQENVYEIRRKLDQYQHLMTEQEALDERSAGTLEELADIQLRLYTPLEPFMDIYRIDLYQEKGGELGFINQLKKDAEEYTKFSRLKGEVSKLEAQVEEEKQALTEALGKFPVASIPSRIDQLKQIEINVQQYESVQGRISVAAAEISKLGDSQGTLDFAQSVEDLQLQQKDVDEEILSINQLISQDQEYLLETAVEMERLNDVSEEIARLEILDEEYKKKADLLSKTADYLQQARENFLSKYMSPLLDGLHKYLGYIENQEKADYKIGDYELDMDLNIKLIHRGHTKSAEYLSAGYQDLVALCARLALLDVLYEKEQPPVILDDPFTNLDEDKIKEALGLLQRISETRQVVYFTCHESRI